MNKAVSCAADELVKPFEFKSMEELLSSPEEETPYCVDDLLPSCGMSCLAAKPKSGKSTVSRQLALAVAQGEPFLDRKTQQGAVLYFAIEEKLSEVAAHFRQLGAGTGDPIRTVCGAVRKEEAVSRLETALRGENNARLVIIDPIFKFLGVRDSSDYVEVGNKMETLLELARKYGVHVFTVHHMKKRETEDPMDGALGSTAIAAAVDTYLALNCNRAGIRTFSTRQRYGIEMPETQLTWNPETKTVSLGLTTDQAQELESEAIQNRISKEILRYVSEHLNCTQDAVFNVVKGRRETKLWVFQQLQDQNTLIRSGEGKKGAPYTYSIATTQATTTPEVESATP